MRVLYTLGLLYVALCAGLIWLGRPVAEPAPARPPHGAPAPAPAPGVPQISGPEWFQRMKPFCNPVEVETRVRFEPPPQGFEGTAYGAGCFALAGKIDKARTLIEGLDPAQRRQAADVVFDLAHPVADAGDDKAAGPIMGLVVEFSTDNYMALYHAGASEFALGRSSLARKHLARFLELYHQNDGWRTSAESMIVKIDGR